MANETLKAGFDKYMAGVEAKLAKNPERAKLPVLIDFEIPDNTGKQNDR